MKPKNTRSLSNWRRLIAVLLLLVSSPLLPAPREAEENLKTSLATAERYLDWQYFAEAKNSYLEIGRQYPELSGVQETLGYICLAQRQFAEAIVFFEKELAQTPDNGLARLLMGLAQFQAGDAAAARESIAAAARSRSSMKKNPFSRKFMKDNPGLIPFVTGLIRKELGEWQEAEEELAEAAEQEYCLAEIMVQLIDQYLQRNDLASCHMLLAKLEPENSQLAEQLAPIVNGRDCQKARELARSRPLTIRYFKQPIALIVDDLNKMARTAVERADPASAFRSWKKALSADDTRFDIHYNLALIYTLYKFLPEGLFHCRRAIDLKHPQFQPLALNLAGNILFEMKDFARASDYYRQAIALDPSYLKCRNNLGASLWKLGDLDNAEREWRYVIRHSGRGGKERDIQELTEAERIKITVDVKEDDPIIEASRSLATLCLQRQRGSEAIPLLEQVLLFKPSDAEAHFELGKLYLYLNEPTRARMHLQEAIRYGTTNESEATALCAKLEGAAPRELLGKNP